MRLMMLAAMTTILTGCGVSVAPVDDAPTDDAAVHATPIAQITDAEESPTDDLGDLDIEAFRDATYNVVTLSESHTSTATAFGIGPRLLATNAHVSKGVLDSLADGSAAATVTQHETGLTYRIVRVWVHPTYVDGASMPTPDVGLLEVNEDLPATLPLPNESFVSEIDVLGQVVVCGFPGSIAFGLDLQNAIEAGDFRPRASCHSGRISAIRPFDPGNALTTTNGRIVQYDATTEPGMSGSGVCLASGTLIAVHAMGYSDGGEQNMGIRIDELLNLLEMAESGALPGYTVGPLGAFGEGCQPICRDNLCDSDCDGWFDHVELNNGHDPCDPYDPPYGPDPEHDAGICWPP